MAARKNQPRTVTRPQKQVEQNDPSQPLVSPRWLISAVLVALVGAVLCAWGALCLLFWQGSWQLRYHPKAGTVQIPFISGATFEPVSFAATETGQLRIQGWWIPTARPGPLARFTIVYLHGASGNLSDSAEALNELHNLGVNVLAFDYRGYGQSQFAHPSEANWNEDANWALDYLKETRHIDPHTIVIAGKELGADLALEVAAAHPDVAGVVVDSPIENPVSVIFNDSRARLVPGHLLVKDRYDLEAAASRLRIPLLWLLPSNAAANAGEPAAFGKAPTQRQLVRLTAGQNESAAIANWLTALSTQ